MMKNTFYFMLKNCVILKIFKFLSCLFGHEGNQLFKKAKVKFKIYDVTDWEKVITIAILSNISRSRGNLYMKFGQVID